jgi:uncharacterized protein YgiM (DUF1202 family)
LQVPSLTNLFSANDEDQEASAPTPPVPVQPPKPDHPQAVVIRDVNLRAAPSTGAGVIAALKQGTAVAILDTRGNWDQVEIVIPGEVSRRGWAYGSYLARTGKSLSGAP